MPTSYSISTTISKTKLNYIYLQNDIYISNNHITTMIIGAVADSTGCIRCVLWENHVNKLTAIY